MTTEQQYLWRDAAQKWLFETSYKKDAKNDRAKLEWIGQHWNDRKLTDITSQVIKELATLKIQTAKPSTVNRYLALIRAIFRRAVNDWEWIGKAPRIQLHQEPKRRIRWLTADQAKTLLNELPAHQKGPVIFALSTGLRAGNVFGLRWNQVDMERRVCWFFGDQVKNSEDLSISLNDAAMNVLKSMQGIHDEYVFSYRGKRIKCLTTKAWYAALKRAGIENFRWHDLRHTWASWLIQEGVPIYALQEMGGWKSVEMVRRYAHLSPAHNLKYAQRIDFNLQNASS